MTAITLIQPRHNYATPGEESTLGHVYLPTSLLTAGARLLQAGVKVQFFDENVNPVPFLDSEYVGINLLGAPYIPEVMRLQRCLVQDASEPLQFLLGGQVVSGLTPAQFQRLFGEQAHNGNDDATLARVLKIDPRSLPSPESTSLVPMYEKMTDHEMERYLSKEFSFYVSQGCRFDCNFCGAVRTTRDPLTGEEKKVTEAYRDPAVMEQDLDYLAVRAERLGIRELNIYLSNLDVFQTPRHLMEFAHLASRVQQQHPVALRLRGLSTVTSFLQTHKHHPTVLDDLISTGFHTVGFGIDGMTPLVWHATGKDHNTEEKCINAIKIAREEYALTPEALMVFGHDKIDIPETLRLAVEFLRDMGEHYGTIPRPHVAKSFIPGNDGWSDPKHAEQVEALLAHPEAFQSLDFTALPSKLTHPDDEMRAVATAHYLLACALPGNTTQSVLPILPEHTPEEIADIQRQNQGKYDR